MNNTFKLIMLILLQLLYIVCVGLFFYKGWLDEKKHSISQRYVEKGNKLLKKGLFDGARAAFTQAVEVDENNSQAWEGLGDTLIWSYENRSDSGDFEEAIDAYQKAVDIDDTNARTNLKLAECLADHTYKYTTEEGWWIFKQTIEHIEYDCLAEAKKYAIEACKYANDEYTIKQARHLLDEIASK